MSTPTMSPKALLRRARRLYSVDYVPEHTNRHNRRQYVRAVLSLGDKWLLAQPVARGQQ